MGPDFYGSVVDWPDTTGGSSLADTGYCRQNWAVGRHPWEDSRRTCSHRTHCTPCTCSNRTGGCCTPDLHNHHLTVNIQYYTFTNQSENWKRVNCHFSFYNFHFYFHVYTLNKQSVILYFLLFLFSTNLTVIISV